MPIEHINGLDLYCELHGAGEPLLLVHGYTGDITDWHFQVAEFSRTHQVLVFDHRGHGRSTAPADRTAYTIERMAADVEALAERVGFARFHLVGHSMGGAVAQEVALRSPQRLWSLTLHDAGNRPAPRTGTFAAVIASTHRTAEEQGMAAVAELHAMLPLGNMPQSRRDEELRRLANMSADAYVGAWGALENWQGSVGRARHIRVPTLVICGETDHSFLVDAARELAAEIPGAVLEMIADAGHSPQIERPEAFNTVLRRHLERHSGQGRSTP